MAEDFDAVTTEAVSDTMPEEAAPQAEEAPQTAEPEPQEETVPPVTEEKPQAEKAEEDAMMHHVFTELREIHRICQVLGSGPYRTE
jgi:hypothetical protein